MDPPPPFMLIKRNVEVLWSQFKYVLSILLQYLNCMFLFKFYDLKTRDADPEAQIWHIVNKPLILQKWQPSLQILDLSLKRIPIWIKI
jgi:hypothetical protein